MFFEIKFHEPKNDLLPRISTPYHQFWLRMDALIFAFHHGIVIKPAKMQPHLSIYQIFSYCIKLADFTHEVVILKQVLPRSLSGPSTRLYARIISCVVYASKRTGRENGSPSTGDKNDNFASGDTWGSSRQLSM